MTAKTADKFDLYQRAIQGPELIQFLNHRVSLITGQRPGSFREDFSGTAFNCCEFVRLHSSNHAIGVDLDKAALRWCHRNNFPKLTESERDRITLIQGDVLTCRTKPVDFIAALNFSYGIFKKRSLLLSYFRNARKSLVPGGVMLLDAHGGSLILDGYTYKNPMKQFTYVCEGPPVDPITNELTLKIHYAFPDGSLIRSAFEYSLRLWSLKELVEILEEAKFKNVHVLWEGTDRKMNTPNGIFRKATSTKGNAYPMWIAYVAGQA